MADISKDFLPRGLDEPLDVDAVEETDVTIEVEPEDDEIVYGDEEVEVEVMGFGENIVGTLSDTDRERLAARVVETFNADQASRADWASAYVRGLDLLGLRIEDRTQPFDGASGVFHPILTESIIRFQAQAMGELFPASGPARTKIMGKQTPELLEQAKRVETELNYQTTEKMVAYREETEQQLFHLPMAGSAFKKVFFDPIQEVPAAMFVAAEDMVVAYGNTNLETADRFTHVMRQTEDEVLALVQAGFYDPEFEPGDPVQTRSDIQEKYDELAGETPAYIADDGRFTILEQHCKVALTEDGDICPYILTVDLSSGKLLAVRENWREDDPKKRARQHFTHYRYLPGLGFYGIGLIHLLGGLTKTATSILRQLIDAGTLANLPAGLKARGMRIKGDNTPFRPGEFRDVDVPGGKISESIMFLPFKEPSAVLYQLLNSVIEEARRIGSVGDTALTDLSKEMPVGTAFAILERQMKVMTGVQARMHNAFKKELQLIAQIIHDYMPAEYDYTEGNRREDFDGRVDVIPVTDPNAATTAQKVVSLQAIMQMAQQAPQLYNMGKLHRQMMDVMHVDNAAEILKLPEDLKPMDPVTENMAILKQEPVKAFLHQDHESHIRVHMAAAQDPKLLQIVGQSPFAEAIQAAMSAHITEHVAYEYRKQLQDRLGVSLPHPEENLPDDVEVALSQAVAEAADKLLRENQAEVAEQEAQAKAEDPVIQMQERELALKEKKQAHDADMDMMRLEMEGFFKGANIAHMRERLNSEEMRAALNGAIKMMQTPSAEQTLSLESARIIAGLLTSLQNPQIEAPKNSGE